VAVETDSRPATQSKDESTTRDIRYLSIIFDPRDFFDRRRPTISHLKSQRASIDGELGGEPPFLPLVEFTFSAILFPGTVVVFALAVKAVLRPGPTTRTCPNACSGFAQKT
jgi:hypothetical protein